MTLQQKIERMKAHAKANYENGWDTFVECYDDAEWTAFFFDHDGHELTLAEAMKLAGRLVEVWEDRRADARNSAF